MDLGNLSRRRFAGALGAALGGALVTPRTASRAEASLPRGYSEDYVQLNSNENPYGPSPAALEAMTRALAVGARYPDAPEDEMIEKIARLHRVDPGRVVLGCGSGEVLRMADLAFLTEGRRVVVAEPTFEAVLAYARVTRAEAVKVPLDTAHRHDLEAMLKACDERTGLVYVCNPNNPTGTIVGAGALAAFVARVPPSTMVVVDEAYHHFVESPDYRSAFELLGQHPNVLVVRTFSKIHALAGMRLGYGVGSEDAIRGLRQHAFASNANAAVLAAGLASLGDEAHEARTRKRMNDTRRWLYRELDKDGRRYIPSEANFTMIEIGSDVKPVLEAFRERKILVGRRFASLPTWLRVSIGTDAEMAAFLEALRGIAPARAAA